VRIARFLLGMMFALATPLAASHGGPEVVEPLGWDPRAAVAYFRIHHLDESVYTPTVVVISRDSIPTNPLPKALTRSFGYRYGEPAYEAWIDSLRRSLQPLEEVPAPAFLRTTEVLHADTLNSMLGRFPRYVVRVTDGLIGHFIVENVLCDPRVVMVRSYRSPDHAVRVAVLAFQALPWEQCYEAQVPVAIQSTWAPVFVRWKRWR
jgi:hypothetical protein